MNQKLMKAFHSLTELLKKNLMEEIRYFSEDAREVCGMLGLAYPVEMEEAVTGKGLNSSIH